MPWRALRILLGLVLSVGACSTTKYGGSIVNPAAVAGIRAENPDDSLRIEIPRRDVVPGFRSGANLPELARLVEVAPDHTTLTLSSEAVARVVPNDSIKRILVIHRVEGAGIGAGIGVIIGLAAAIAVGATYSDPCAHSTSWGCVDFSSGDMSVLTGFIVGIPATLIGAALGAAIGSRSYYTFGPPTAARAD